MSVEDLRDQGLLLPEEQWGQSPSVSWRSRVQLVVCGVLFVVSALLIWFGRGGSPTFVGIGLFLVSLFIFVYFTFRAVDFQVSHLMDLGVGGKVEGLQGPVDRG